MMSSDKDLDVLILKRIGYINKLESMILEGVQH